MLNHNESTAEKLVDLIPGKVFKSYKELCECLGVKPTGGNRKKTFLAELSRYCTWKKDGNKYIIIEVLDFPLPKIDNQFLSSEFYPSCGYLLLKFLAEEYNSFEMDDPCYIATKRRIMKIMRLCNSNFNNYEHKLIEDSANKNSEFFYFIEQGSAYLYKQADRVLGSLKLRGFLSYDEIYMVISGNNEREATEEEIIKINDCYDFIVEKYNFRSKNSIRFSKHKKEIDSEIKENLGFKFYRAVRFNLTDDLAGNAEYLKGEAKLTEKYGFEVNSLVCSKIYNLLFDSVIKIRDKENKELAGQRKLLEKFKELGEREFINQFLDTKLETELSISPAKFNKKHNFSSDDDVVRYRLEEFIKQFIRVVDLGNKHESNIN